MVNQITELLSKNISILIGQFLTCILALLLEKFLIVPKVHLKLWGFKIAAMQFCLISFFYYIFLLVTGKIIFTAVMVLALLLILIIVNNAKYKNLQEPLVFSDYDYFTDAFRFPRLYIPFLGISGIVGIVIGALLIIFGYFKDITCVNRLELESGLGISLIWLVISALFLHLNIRTSKLVVFKPKEDIDNLGFVMYLWCYFIEYLKRPYPISKFEYLSLKSFRKSKGNANDANDTNVLPHLIAIQSESFFDPRSWNCNIKEDILATFDEICNKSRCYGKLTVPAFGANTIRTEFSFLTGVSPSVMKGHQFSPYQIMSRKSFELKSMVNLLKSHGYYTVCIHPYYKNFYHRDIIFKKWGFDEFLDIENFDKNEIKGAYIGDEAITKRILSIIKHKTSRPVFIFAITMENHGPMHLEKISEAEFKQCYKQESNNKLVDYDLSVYLNHVRNADKMIKDLTTEFNNIDYPISMVFYGDHIPIMPTAYKNIGIPNGMVPYFIWDNNSFSNAFNSLVNELERENEATLATEKVKANEKGKISNQDSLNVLNIDLKIEDLSVTWLSRVTY